MTHPYPTVFSDFDPELIAECNADCHCTPEFMEETSSFPSSTLSGGSSTAAVPYRVGICVGSVVLEVSFGSKFCAKMHPK